VKVKKRGKRVEKRASSVPKVNGSVEETRANAVGRRRRREKRRGNSLMEWCVREEVVVKKKEGWWRGRTLCGMFVLVIPAQI